MAKFLRIYYVDYGSIQTYEIILKKKVLGISIINHELIVIEEEAHPRFLLRIDQELWMMMGLYNELLGSIILGLTMGISIIMN